MENNSKTVGNGQAIDLEKVPAAVWTQLVLVRGMIWMSKVMGLPFEKARSVTFAQYAGDFQNNSLLGCFVEIEHPEKRSFTTVEEWSAALAAYLKNLAVEKEACVTFERVLADAKAIFPEVDDETLRSYVEKEASRRKAALRDEYARKEEDYAAEVADKESEKVMVSRDETGVPVNIAGKVLEDRRWTNAYDRVLQAMGRCNRSKVTAGAWNILSYRYSSRGPRSASRRPSRTAVGASSPGGGGSPGDDSGGSEPPQGDPDLPSFRFVRSGTPRSYLKTDRFLSSWRPGHPVLMSRAFARIGGDRA